MDENHFLVSDELEDAIVDTQSEPATSEAEYNVLNDEKIREFFSSNELSLEMKNLFRGMDDYFNEGKLCTAIFMNRDHEVVVDAKDAEGHLRFKINRHMTTLSPGIHLRSLNNEVDYETDSDFGGGMYRPQETLNDIAQGVAACNKVRCHLNYQAVKRITFKSLALKDNLKEEWNSWPKHVRTTVKRWNAEGFHIIQLEIEMNPKYIPGERFNIGTPTWGQKWVDSIKSGYIKVIVVGSSRIKQSIDIIEDIFSFQRKSRLNEPLRVWHKNKIENIFQKDFMEFDFKPEHSDFETSQGYHDFSHCGTVKAIEMIQDDRDRFPIEREFSDRQHSLTLLSPAGYENREFIGLVKSPTGGEVDFDLRPKTFMRVDLYLNNNRKSCSRGWSAMVVSPIRKLPQEYLHLRITRGKITESEIMPDGSIQKVERWDPLDVPYIKVSSLNDDAILSAIESFPNIKAKLTIQISDSVTFKCLQAIDRLEHCPADETNTEWQDNARRILSSADLSDVAEKNGLACITESQPEFWKRHGSLDEDQKAACRQMTRTKGGVVIIDGLSGTGKTYLAQQIALQMMSCKEKKDMTVVLVDSNTGADQLAAKLDVRASSSKTAGLIPKNRYILRVHSQNSEGQITNMAFKNMEYDRPTALRNYIAYEAEDALEHELGEIAKLLRDAIKSQDYRVFQNVNDSRVRQLKFSPSLAMFRKCGMLDDIPDMIAEDITPYAEFIRCYELKLAGKKVSTADEASLKRHTAMLYQQVLEEASVIIATHTGIYCDERNMEVITKHCRILVVDDAMKCREWELYPLFAAPFEQLDMFLMAGDCKKIGPQPYGQVVSKSDAPFREQTKISLPTRLAHAGFPVCHFSQQHRMTPPLSDMLDGLFQHGCTHHNADTASNYRTNANLFRVWAGGMNRRYKGNESITTASLMRVDFTGRAVEVLKGPGQSKFCNAFIIWLMQELRFVTIWFTLDLQIGIITPYAEERNRLSKAITAFRESGQCDTDFSRVHVRTVDECQSEEFNVVFFLLTIDEKVGHIGDPERLYTALSRATGGLVVLTNYRRGHFGRGKRLLIRDTLELLKRGISIDVKWDKLPVSEFYNPRG